MRADVFLVEAVMLPRAQAAPDRLGGGVAPDAAGAWKKVAKNGDDIPAHGRGALLDDAEAKYISRGGLKLEARSGDRPGGQRLALPGCGQSTGGFTDCLLQPVPPRSLAWTWATASCTSACAMTRAWWAWKASTPGDDAESLLEGCDEACEEEVQEEEDNDTQPVAPYAWMRNGGLVDEDYDDSDDAKEQDVEAFKAERAAKAKARAEGSLPVVRRRKPGVRMSTSRPV
jgi:23S rRNA (cytidine1920-2'-O)/16S rRNA (cytidine1409-2'-O)-methyltransferase